MNKKENIFLTVEYVVLGLVVIAIVITLVLTKSKPSELDNTQVNISDSSDNAQDIESDISNYEELGNGISEDESSEQVISTSEESKDFDIIKPVKFEIGEYVPLPTLPTNIKSYTDYRCYNLWYTPHYRLQQASRTDENGLRRFNDDYIVAMGAFYSTHIGDRFEVTLDNGNTFTVILGDGKHPNDCDEYNMYAPCYDYNGNLCANVLEFIIDSDVMSKEVYSYGSIDCIDEFKGNIVKIVYLGRDNSADWDTYEVR